MGRKAILFLLIALTGARPAMGQSPDQAPARDPGRNVNVFAITEALEKNREALARYTWKLKLEVALEGALLSEELFQASYNADGTLRSDVLEASETALVRRRGRKARRDREHRQRLKNLLMAYVEMPPERLDDAMTNAVSTDNPAGGSTTRVQARGAIREGDSYDLWIDTATRRPHRFEVFTSLQGEPVRLVAGFERLENGPVYPAEATVETEVGEKKMVISIRNYDFEKL